MLQWLSGYWFSQTLYVVAELGIADLLRRGPRSCAHLARDARVHEESLYRLLRALAAVGLFRQVPPRRFALTPLSETLLGDRPDSLLPLALLGGHPFHWRAWGELLHSVRTGRTAFTRANGVDLFAGLGKNRTFATAFRGVMRSLTAVDSLVVDRYDFSSARTVVDVGGGRGELLSRILDRCPQTRGILLERPEVLRQVPRRKRLRLAAGDFLTSLPEGGDLYVLKFVLHNWDDRRAATLLARCRSAMRGTGRLLIVESLLGDARRTPVAETHDVNMLVLTGGRERTRSEFSALLRRSGFRLARVIATTTNVHMLEAVPLRAR